MKYNVKWIINGEITYDASSKEEAEKKVNQKLKDLINENKASFKELGAMAIQGTATFSK